MTGKTSRLHRAAGVIGLVVALSMFFPATSDGAQRNVSGVVCDVDGTPIANARVLVTDIEIGGDCVHPFAGEISNLSWASRAGAGEDPTALVTTRTSDEGTFEFALPTDPMGLSIVAVEAAGYAPQVVLFAGNPDKIEMASGLEVRVHVRNDLGEALPASRVTLVPLSICGSVLGSFTRQLIQRADTDRQGVATLTHVATGLYAIRVEQEMGPIELFAPIEIRSGRSEYAVAIGRSGEGDTISESLEMLDAPTGDVIQENKEEIHGTVTQEGRPEALRHVIATVDYKPPIKARTYYAALQEGHFSFWSIARRPVLISMALPGPAGPTSRIVIANDYSALRLTLPRSATFSGTVVSLDSGKPIDSARVELVPAATSGSSRIMLLTAVDPDGRWRFDGFKPGPYELKATAPGYATAFVKLLAVDSAEATEYEFHLKEVGDVQGSVSGLNPGQNATVHLLNLFDTTYSVERPVSELGNFDVPSVPPGKHMLFLDVQGLEEGEKSVRSISIVVEAGRTTYVDFDLAGGVFLGGKVYLGDEVVPLADLSFNRISATIEENDAGMTRTDDEGRYSILLKHAGSHLVKFRSADLGLHCQSRLRIDVPPDGSEETDLEFGAGILSGRVVDPNGEPVAEAEVWPWLDLEKSGPEADQGEEWNEPGVPFHPIQTGADGAFEFNCLGPDRYLLTVSAQGYAQKKVGPIELGRGEIHPLPDIVLDRGSSLNVQAVAPDGQPLGNTQVAAIRGRYIGRTSGPPPIAMTSADGRASLEGLSEGIYSLVGMNPALPPAIKDGVGCCAAADEPPVELMFQRGGSLEIQFLGDDGAPVEGCRLRLLDESGRDLAILFEGILAMSNRNMFPDGNGYLRLDAVQPGTYSISAIGLKGEATATVSEGHSTQVILYVEPVNTP